MKHNAAAAYCADLLETQNTFGGQKRCHQCGMVSSGHPLVTHQDNSHESEGVFSAE